MVEPPTGAFVGVAELGAAYRSGATTPLAVAEAAMARIEALEPRLNAVIDLMRGPALRAAEAATRELRAGRDRGPLHGVPVAIKDLVDIAGLPTGYATRAVDPVVAVADAALVRHLREAGAVPLAKTNLLEFAYGIAHPEIGQTNNPWDVNRTSGGSSGGSAALVAAGAVPVAVGTDTGGSIRIPASYCGIVGFKPSYGLVSTEGVFPLSWSLDHAGPLARSVADAATLLSGLVGRAIVAQRRPLAGLRIGLVRAHLDSRLVTAGVREAVSAALDRLGRGGATLVPVSVPEIDAVNGALVTILKPEAALAHESLVSARPDGYAPGTRAQLEAGRRVSGIDYVRAQRFRARLTRAVEALFEDVDLLLSPAVGFVAPAEDPVIQGGDGDGEMLSSGLANVTGHPAISLPCGFSDGLPVGLQLIGPGGRDADLLSGAAAVEAGLAFSGRPRL
jgi:aspartyl-tRNA(Asn)/glutamyl-tRNA(Gln) amidotransferase subunit A